MHACSAGLSRSLLCSLTRDLSAAPPYGGWGKGRGVDTHQTHQMQAGGGQGTPHTWTVRRLTTHARTHTQITMIPLLFLFFFPITAVKAITN